MPDHTTQMTLPQAVRILIAAERNGNPVARSLSDQLVHAAKTGRVSKAHGNYDVLADRAINYAECLRDGVVS